MQAARYGMHQISLGACGLTFHVIAGGIIQSMSLYYTSVSIGLLRNKCSNYIQPDFIWSISNCICKRSCGYLYTIEADSEPLRRYFDVTPQCQSWVIACHWCRGYHNRGLVRGACIESRQHRIRIPRTCTMMSASVTVQIKEFRLTVL